MTKDKHPATLESPAAPGKRRGKREDATLQPEAPEAKPEGQLREKLMENTAYFRREISRLGFHIREGIHPIVPVMLGEARLAAAMASALLEEGVYVTGFSFPVVPKGQARIRVQLSAAHEQSDLDFVLEKFGKVGKALGVI